MENDIKLISKLFAKTSKRQNGEIGRKCLKNYFIKQSLPKPLKGTNGKTGGETIGKRYKTKFAKTFKRHKR